MEDKRYLKRDVFERLFNTSTKVEMCRRNTKSSPSTRVTGHPADQFLKVALPERNRSAAILPTVGSTSLIKLKSVHEQGTRNYPPYWADSRNQDLVQNLNSDQQRSTPLSLRRVTPEKMRAAPSSKAAPWSHYGVVRESEEVVSPYSFILELFDTDGELPSLATASAIFRKLDTMRSGTICLSKIEDGIREESPNGSSQPFALRVFRARNKDSISMGKTDFHVFLLFLVFFNSLWEKFDFGGLPYSLQVARKQADSIVGALGLFQDNETAYNALENDGFIQFDDLCALCAQRHQEMYK